MSTLPPERHHTLLRRLATDAFAALCRPFLRFSFALYQLEVRRNLYPRDALVRSIDGFDPQRMLFVGDIAASGHGVLSHGLTVATRTADFVKTASGRGVELSIIAETDLTIEKLLAKASFEAEGVEIAFLAVGIPDVLLLTRVEQWQAGLRETVKRIQRESGNRACRVYISEVPPLSDFRPISPAMRRIIVNQVTRLNRASAAVADETPGLTAVPFPLWRLDEMYVKRFFSWKTMHEVWAQTLAAAAYPGGPASPPSLREP